MAIRTIHDTTEDTWFVSFTCYNWLSLFEITQSYDLVYKWLNVIGNKRDIKTLAFAIMPNHVHVLLCLPDKTINLNTVISNAKRLMAYEIINRLKEQGSAEILHTLSSACTEMDKAKGQLHRAFQPSFDAKPVYTFPFLYQKIDYIHNNPVSGRWHLANEFTEYPHSSAAFYVLQKQHPFVNISDYRDYWF